MLKDVTIQTEVTPEEKKTRGLSLVLKSQDKNNSTIELKFKDIELDDTYTVTVLSVFSDGIKQYYSNCEIENGNAYFKFDTSLITESDRVYNFVYIQKEGKSADVDSFSFKVDLSELDKTAKETATVYDFNYETLLNEFEEQLLNYLDSLPEFSVEDGEVVVDLSDYALKDELEQYVLKSELQELIGDRESEEVDLSDYALRSELPDLSGFATETYVDTALNNLEQPEMNLEDYALKSEIPDITGFATEDYVDTAVAGITQPDLSDYALRTEIPDVSNFITMSEVPETDLTGYATEDYVDTAIAGIDIPEVDLSNYALKTDLPDLPDFEQFLTEEDIPSYEEYDDTEVRGLIEDKQDKLVAGDNITIDGNTISASSSGGGGGSSSNELEWVTPVLADGWTNDIPEIPFKYAIDDEGKIHLRGTLRLNTNTSTNNAPFELPNNLYTEELVVGEGRYSPWFPIYTGQFEGNAIVQRFTPVNAGMGLGAIRIMRIGSSNPTNRIQLFMGRNFSSSSGQHRFYINAVVELKDLASFT